MNFVFGIEQEVSVNNFIEENMNTKGKSGKPNTNIMIFVVLFELPEEFLFVLRRYIRNLLLLARMLL